MRKAFELAGVRCKPNTLAGPSSTECRYAGMKSWFDWMGSQWPSMGVRSRPRVISVEQVVFGRSCKDPNWVLSGIAYTNYHRLVPGSILSEQLLMGNSMIADRSIPGRWVQRARERWNLLGFLFALTRAAPPLRGGGPDRPGRLFAVFYG